MSDVSVDPTNNLLEVENLHVHFDDSKVRAVDGVSFSVPALKTVGLVGESGSGKTTVGRAIVRLVSITQGYISYEGKRISALNRKDFMPYRKRIQMIFQDPHHSLNPRLTAADIIGEALKIHFPSMIRQEKEERIDRLMEKVNLDPAWKGRFPHEFSGGQKQRIGIARALAVEPDFIICDEPVSALDVSVQAQIINLLQDLQEDLGLTLLFIAHDLAVVEHVSDYILVMQNGKIVEQATADLIYQNPEHPYTKKLLQAVPSIPVG